MKITKLNCSACGAPISIPEDLDFINCSSCGSFLAIERGEGYVALKIAEKLARAIEDSGKGTQDAIRESSYVTRNELQRLQLTQELSAAQLHLNNIQAEIRAIQRGGSTPIIIAQTKNLKFSEYQAMDKVRNLEQKMISLTSVDLPSQINNIEREMQWLKAEIDALNYSEYPQRKPIIDTLTVRWNELDQKLFGLKVQELKQQLKSYQVPEPSINDQKEVADFLAILAEDENKIRNLKTTRVGKVVYSEITKRYQKYWQAWQEMERDRILRQLSTPTYQPESHTLESLHQYLSIIDQDLASLSQSPGNEIIREIQRKLQQDRQRIIHQIKDIEKRQAKAAKQALKASQSQSSGGNGFFLVTITGFFAGIAALFSEILGRSTPTTRDNGQVTAHVSEPGANAESESSNVRSDISGSSTSPINSSTASDLAYQVEAFTGTGKSDVKSIGKGCILSILLIAAITIVGCLIGFLLIPNSKELTGPQMFFLLMVPALGFIIGSWVFLRNAAPNAVVQKFLVLPEIRFSSRASTRGLQNPLAVKALLGIIVWIITWFISLALMFLFIDQNNGATLSSIIFVVGFLLGPIQGLLTFIKTTVATE